MPTPPASHTPRTIHDRVTELGLKMTSRPRKSNPFMDDDGRDPGQTHWTCVLTMPDGRKMRLPYSMGSAHVNPPEVGDVLNCLALDASGIVSSISFESWCSEYGYSDDSRKAERTYRACVKQTDDLKSLLGAAFDDVVFDTESL